tara:strand:+ start:262 stop:459 length:198 start_codon:yes stop_codon:yes gene_type:complete
MLVPIRIFVQKRPAFSLARLETGDQHLRFLVHYLTIPAQFLAISMFWRWSIWICCLSKMEKNAII